jgi:formylglycine-generating enzyme required for sulfatase activity
MPTPPIRAHDDEQALALKTPARPDPESPPASLMGAHEGEARVIGGVEFVWVPPGLFWMGSSKHKKHPFYDKDALSNEFPGGFVALTHGYWIGRFPVLNEEYGRYVEQKKGEVSPPEDWKYPRFRQARQPLMCVDWLQAVTYCQWLTQESLQSGDMEAGWECRLPTSAEWERAARGIDGRRYPWGDEAPDEERAVFAGTNSTKVVGDRGRGASPAGCHDMAGHVWEWCLDEFGKKSVTSEEGVNLSHEEFEGWRARVAAGTPGVKIDFDAIAKNISGLTKQVSPYRRNDTRAALGRVVRGGSWRSPGGLRCAFWHWYGSFYQSQDLGFRVVCAPLDAL